MIRTCATRIPRALIALALLAVLDGITTHVGLALGAHEVNPLLAMLYGIHPLAGEAFRVSL